MQLITHNHCAADVHLALAAKDSKLFCRYDIAANRWSAQNVFCTISSTPPQDWTVYTIADDGDQARTGIDELLRQALELLVATEEGGGGAGQEAGGRVVCSRSSGASSLRRP